MKASAQLVEFLQGYESCRLEPYLDQGGHWTIGWGHLMGPCDPRVPITQEEADSLFQIDLLRFEDGVNELTAGVIDLRQHEFDALVSFSFNVGLDIDDDQVAEGLGDSTLLKRVLAGNFVGAALEFPKWRRTGGQESLGLLKRRCAEMAIFLLADYRWN